MLELIILGAVQGIAEWLPVSSEGLIFLIKTNFFTGGESLVDILKLALFLHFGTFLAALVYFRKDVLYLLKAFFNYKKADEKIKSVLNFLIITTIITAVLGFLLLKIIENIKIDTNQTAWAITLFIGFLLLITSFLQLRVKDKKEEARGERQVKKADSFILGIVQSLAVLPGLSRSGLTVSTLLIRKIDKSLALKLSFLMSLPVVLGANIILNLDKFVLTWPAFLGLLSSFVFGLITINLLLKLARRVNFAVFVLIFAVLTIISAFVF